ncbi:aminotransferase class I/II-fold pyridoxal phosphate-dependent enzyme [Caenimonas soli]|uniref:aminotransferase class I/II-fold pyridoxal phosphate-dependent enzyme n=1 Tax=Caenimonas soli TaxID=2735555 RepID=UPI001552507E|nr:aminotransferase class I/II-fold pyridoxal phosphate-dependent enzyme [Caenimonas soli]NPC57567.1 aminotransferase class I/II-fold pyridoxal phosphate-dependent enzyme [Caenimonas soli]
MVMQAAHGGPDYLGIPLHDFSSNGNACGPCPAALLAVQDADPTRYPDPAYTELRAGLAAFHRVAVQRVVLAASGSEFIMRMTSWVRGQGGRSVWVPSPGYGDYAQAALAHGLELARASDGADLAWDCDPSSPLGQADRGLARLRAATVVLDRAYEPLRLSGSPATGEELLLSRCWQLWTPNKALGLTGVRAAYAIAPLGGHEAARQLEALAPSWPIGSHGVAMLLAWCEPAVQEWLSQSLRTLRDWKRRQVALCESLGWECLPSDTNFFLARNFRPGSLEQLRARDIKLRDCASFGLPDHARLSVQPPAVQDALEKAWKSLA